MKLKSINKSEIWVIMLSVILILFWFVAAGSKLYDFNEWKQGMQNQIFSRTISTIILYLLPALEIIIATLLVRQVTRLAGMILSFSLMMVFTIYVGLALLEVYSRTPCNCAGLLGENSSWGANFKLNIFVTGFALAGLILTIKFKRRERRDRSITAVTAHTTLTVG